MIINTTKLFNLCYFFQDDNLFDYLVDKLLNSWTNIVSEVLGGSLDYELLCDIFTLLSIPSVISQIHC